MGQIEIIEVLKSSPKEWMCSRDIQPLVEINLSSIGCCMKRLRKGQFVDWCFMREDNSGRYIYYYKLGTGENWGKLKKTRN